MWLSRNKMSDTGRDFVHAAHLRPRGTSVLSVRSSEDTFPECCIVLVLERTINLMSPDTLETREKNHGTFFSVFYVSLTACVCPWCPSVAQTHHTLFLNPPFSFLPLNVSWDPSPWLRNKAAGVSADAIDGLMKSASLYENRKWHLLTVCAFVTSLSAPSEVFQKHPSRWNKTFLLSCITFPCCLFSNAFSLWIWGLKYTRRKWLNANASGYASLLSLCCDTCHNAIHNTTNLTEFSTSVLFLIFLPYIYLQYII